MNGLRSSILRQRLLEKENFYLQEGYEFLLAYMIAIVMILARNCIFALYFFSPDNLQLFEQENLKVFKTTR